MMKKIILKFKISTFVVVSILLFGCNNPADKFFNKTKTFSKNKTNNIIKPKNKISDKAYSISKDEIFNNKIILQPQLLTEHSFIGSVYIKDNMVLYEAIDKIGVSSDLIFKSFLLNINTLNNINLDDIGTQNPKFSPNGKLIAYEKYNKVEDSIKVNIWVMDLSDNKKRIITNDGKSKIIKWVSNNEIILKKVEEDTGMYNWATIGYERINILNRKIIQITSIPEKSKKIKLKLNSNKLEPVKWDDEKWYDFFYKNKKVFSVPYVVTESEWRWEPDIIWISENDFLTVLFIPLPDKKPPYFFKSGNYDLVKVNCNNLEVKTIHKDVSWLPRLTISPDRKLITFRGDSIKSRFNPDCFFFMNQNCSKKREIKFGFIPSWVTWSPDSKFCILVQSRSNYKDAMYKLDFK